MTAFSPREIVSELDRYIVGQHAAKRAVAVALRNRWRRLQLPEALRKEIEAKAELAAEERVLDALVGQSASADTRQKFRRMLREGQLNDREIEVQVQDAGGGFQMPTLDIPGMPGAQMGMINLNEM